MDDCRQSVSCTQVMPFFSVGSPISFFHVAEPGATGCVWECVRVLRGGGKKGDEAAISDQDRKRTQTQ